MKKVFLAIFVGIIIQGFLWAQASQKQEWEWSKYGIEMTDNPDAIPTAYKSKWKVAQMEQIKKANLHTWGIKTIMLGDSITAGWRWSPKAKNSQKILRNLAKSTKKGNIYSFAISGDETKNVLWQLTKGEAVDKRIKPLVVTLMIGVNNILRHKEDAAIQNTADGIKTILTVLKKKYPEAKILLLAVLPHFGEKFMARAIQLNKLIEKFADFEKVYYLDMSEKFLKDGKVNNNLFYDGIHPNAAGYQVWADTMKPYLEDLLKNKGEGKIWEPLKEKYLSKNEETKK
jgi:lysophospholipase L1-like esterase